MTLGTQPADLQFFATAAKGIEALLADELRTLAVDAGTTAGTVRQEGGGASFDGPLALGYRACLWSRLAQRVLMRIATLPLDGGADGFWSDLAAVDWMQHLAPHGTLAVDFSGLGSAVGVDNFLFGAQRTKDVIVDQFRERIGRRPSVDLVRPDVRVNVHVGPREALVSLDLSGESLHRRGYRAVGEQVEAPLKETLAAAILMRAGWPALAAEGGSLVDPLSGSGTLPIEAALIAGDVAPGLLRQRWGFSGWLGHDAALWEELLAEAGERREAALARLRAARTDRSGHLRPVAFGFDHDARAVEVAQADVARARLRDLVQIERRGLAELRRPVGLDPGAAGLIVANPPYGHRIGARVQPARRRPRADSGKNVATPMTIDPALAALYSLLGERLRSDFAGWKAAILVNDLGLGKRLGLRARRSNRFMNGPLSCTLLRIDIDQRAAAWGDAATPGPGTATPGSAAGAESPPRAPIGQDPGRLALSPQQPPASAAPASAPGMLSQAAEQFANRLRKNARHWGRYMRRAGIACYRVYDADLPDFAVAIDVYERWVHVQEYAPPPEIDEAKAAARLNEAMAVIPEVLGAAPGDVFLKVRERQRGAAQYPRRAAHGLEHEVHEGDLAFLVNFTDFLDTGLFPQMREVRRLLRDLGPGQSFLNLFGYTGTASVAAGKGGAARTTTVDLNGRYLEWAQRNLALNKLRPARNEVVEADVLQWVAEGGAARQYGVVYLDPPTFSNSKKMGRATFDVRRDHADLIRMVTRRLLAPGGVVIFACNARRFAMNGDALARDHELEDLSRATLPPDFARRARSHHVWRITPR
jgi:23S rRNA (guanine2445-N2)-methyltransferase / 23S rRNA (guanine2069-N7)-methyltransferase